MSYVSEALYPSAQPSRQASVEATASRGYPLTLRSIESGGEYDAIAAQFDGICQEQLYAYAQRRWPGVAIEPVVFQRGEETVGGTLVMVQSLPLKLGAIAICKWGPILKDAQRSDFDAVYLGMVEALVAEYAIKRKMMVSILPRAATRDTNRELDLLVAQGFRKGAGLAFPDRYLVNLRLSDSEQRKSFAQKWRYHLNKSEKAGLSFEHAGPERLAEFTALYEAMNERKDFANHSAYDTVPALMATPVDALRPELFFVRHEGECVAGAVIWKTGDTAVYLYGATNEKALPLRAGYFLHWHIIRWLRDNTRAAWYDLGGSDGFHGLHQFKKGMVGDRGAVQPIPPIAYYAAYTRPMLLGRAAFGLRELATRLGRMSERFRFKAKPDLKLPRGGEAREG